MVNPLQFAMDAYSDARKKHAQNMRLGQLIAALEKRDADQSVRFDFGYFRPAGLLSFRGYYEDLALGYEAHGDITVSDLLAELREAVGKTFTGYKGGDFTMDLDTVLWAANNGDANSTAIIGIADCDWQTVIGTAFIDQ